MAAPAMLAPPVPPSPASVRLRRFLQLWAAGAAAAVAVTAASAAGWLEPLQVRTLDLVQQLGGQRFPPEVVIVAIDEAAFEKLGARQPIPRGYLARVLRGLDRSGAAVVGLDIALSVATTPAEDAALAEALRGLAGGPGRRHRVVLVDARPPESGPLADSTLLAAVPRGSDRVPVDDDGLIRHVAALVPEPGPRPVPAFALAVLGQQALADASPGTAAPGAAPEDLARYPYWRAGGWAPAGGPPTPLRAGELWRVNFVGPRGSFLTIPSDALAELGDPGAPPVAEDNPLRGRIALVGATFPESRDFFQTPVGRLAGVEVHANVVHMLATRSLIRPAGWGAALAVQIAVVGLAALLLAWLRPLAGTLAALALTVALGVPASYLAFHGGGYAVDFLLPVLATCLTGIGAHALARRRFRDTFGRYVGRDVMQEVLAENPTLQGDRREVSVLVSDLRGFTTLSETMPAEQVAAHLNEYFPAMIDAIFAERGMVNDFIGDGILAVFGAPLPEGDHAWRAARAALAMQTALETLNREWAARGIATLRMGIGIHTGMVFAGNVGGPSRIKYTVVGDTVNVTARLEGLNKELGTTTLITAEVEKALGDRVETRYRGEAPVKGRAEPLRVYELLALSQASSSAQNETGKGSR
ncbi:MAG TPA: adenylate/guanylate cyclase domain-containing protein [Methylomirabilota bacterium]|jgi:adenylate cyclase